jgi:hypothetical protein
MGLELAGYTIVDTELVNAEARLRFTTQQGYAEHVEIEGDGPDWSELSPGQQHTLLVAMGVDGVFGADITMSYGSVRPFEQRVSIRIAVSKLDGTLAWSSDCGVVTSGFDFNEATANMLERASRCALDSEASW